MGKYFGTDGFRGEANVTLTVEDAYKVGLVLWTEDESRSLSGRDRQGYETQQLYV